MIHVPTPRNFSPLTWSHIVSFLKPSPASWLTAACLLIGYHAMSFIVWHNGRLCESIQNMNLKHKPKHVAWAESNNLYSLLISLDRAKDDASMEPPNWSYIFLPIKPSCPIRSCRVKHLRFPGPALLLPMISHPSDRRLTKYLHGQCYGLTQAHSTPITTATFHLPDALSPPPLWACWFPSPIWPRMNKFCTTAQLYSRRT